MNKVALINIAAVSAGQSAPKKNAFSDNGIPFVRAGSLELLLSGKKESDLELVSVETAKIYKLKLYPKGAILFAKSGMSATKDRIYVLQNPAYVVSHLAILVPNDNVHADYLRLTLKLFPPSVLIKDLAYPAISLREIQGYKIPIPEEMDDQIRIAQLLSKVEGLISQRKQNLQLLDGLLKSVFMDMFGDPVRNEKGWEEKFLGDLFKVKHGFAFKSEFFNDAGRFVLLTPGNFFEEGGFRERGHKQKYYIGEIQEAYILNKNDLLVAMTEQTPGLLGSPIIVPESHRYLHNQRLGLVEPKEPIQILFLFHLFNQKSIRQIIHSKATGAKVRHTSPTKIENIVIGYPPIILQNQFACIVEKVEGIKVQYHKSLSELKNLYGSLSQKAFKGELDLSRIPLPEDSGPKHHKIIITEQVSIEENIIAMIEYPMSTSKERMALLRSLFDDYLNNNQKAVLSLDDFWQEANFKTIDLMDEFDKPWGVEDYDQIMKWIFEMINDGKLEQQFVEDSKKIELTIKA